MAIRKPIPKKALLTPEERKRRSTRRWRMALLGVLLIVAALGALSQTSLGERIAIFREYCQSLRRGYPLAAVRQEALNRELLYEEDPDPVGFPEDTGYVIRPSAAWPHRYGCRVWASRGVITRLER